MNQTFYSFLRGRRCLNSQAARSFKSKDDATQLAEYTVHRGDGELKSEFKKSCVRRLRS